MTYDLANFGTGPGTYVVGFTAYDPNGCGDTTYRDTIIFSIPDTLTLSLTSIPNIAGCAAPFVAVPSASVITAVDNYYWTIDGVRDPAYDNVLSPSLVFADSGLHTVWFVVETSDTNYCTPTDSTMFTVQVDQVATFSPTLNFPIPDPCPPAGQIQDLSIDINLLGTVIPDSIVWNFGDNTGDSITYNPVISMHYVYQTSGVYPVTFTAYAPDGCGDSTFTQIVEFKDTSGLTLQIEPIPDIEDCGSAPYIVDQVTTTLHPAVTSYYWTLDNDPTQLEVNNLTPTFTLQTIGSHTVWFYGETTDTAYCINKDSTSLDVNIIKPQILTVDVSTVQPPPCDPGAIASYPVEVSAESDVRDITSAEWMFVELGDTTTINSIAATYVYTEIGQHTFFLSAYDSLCDVTLDTSFDVTYEKGAILDDLVVPNIFTPNDDSFNDKLEIDFKSTSGITDYKKYFSYEIEIYNRWGGLLFAGGKEAEGKEKLWDGKNEHNGKDVKEGVYFYILHFESLCSENNKNIETTGHVTIVR